MAFAAFLSLPRNFLLYINVNIVKVVEEDDVSGTAQLFDKHCNIVNSCFSRCRIL